MIVDDYADIARRMKQTAPDFSLPEGTLIITSLRGAEIVRSASWVFILNYAGLRMIKSRDYKNATDFVDYFKQFLPSAQSYGVTLIMLSPEDHQRLSDWLQLSHA